MIVINVLYCCHIVKLLWAQDEKISNMSSVMRKPDICICENKDANQLHSNHSADQRICISLHRWYNSYTSYIRNFKPPLSYLLWLYSSRGGFVLDLRLETPEGRFSLDKAQIEEESNPNCSNNCIVSVLMKKKCL